MTFRYRRSYHGGIQAVLLDWAGTTMDFDRMTPAVVFVEVFKRKGVPITMEEARAPMGAHKRVHIQRITVVQQAAVSSLLSGVGAKMCHSPGNVSTSSLSRLCASWR